MPIATELWIFEEPIAQWQTYMIHVVNWVGLGSFVWLYLGPGLMYKRMGKRRIDKKPGKR